MDKIDLTAIEDPMRYDWVALYIDSEWNRYSRNLNPIEKDELCRYWYIYKVKHVKDWEWTFNYHYEIISRRPDINLNTNITKDEDS